MSNFNRITPEQVAEAYKLTGIKPVNNQWGSENEEGKCGCALTVIAYSLNLNDADYDFIELLKEMESSRGRIAGEFTNEYLEGFMNGYDDNAMIKLRQSNEIYRAGCEDGEAAFEHMKKQGAFVQWKEVLKADYSIPVGPTAEFSELFLEESEANNFAEKHNLKLLHTELIQITETDYNKSFNR